MKMQLKLFIIGGLIGCALLAIILFSTACISKIDPEVVKQYPSYNTRVVVNVDDTWFFYYVQPNAGWEIKDGVLTLSDYVILEKHQAAHLNQRLIYSPAFQWTIKDDAREEVR